jgi:hypothetical protein
MQDTGWRIGTEGDSDLTRNMEELRHGLEAKGMPVVTNQDLDAAFSYDDLLPTVADIDIYCSRYGIDDNRRTFLKAHMDAVKREVLNRLELQRRDALENAVDEVLRRNDML